MTRFGASRAEPVTLGLSGATVVRLERAGEVLFWKSGEGVEHEADRLLWLETTGVPCPRVLDRGDDWMLTSQLAGRDAAQPWPEADRPRVIDAIAEGLLLLHALTVDCPFTSPFPGEGEVVTHGDYAAPNVFLDPATLQFSGVLDLARLGRGDRYVDVALMSKSLSGELNPQYGGPPAARRFVEACGADPDDPRIKHYITLDGSGAYQAAREERAGEFVPADQVIPGWTTVRDLPR